MLHKLRVLKVHLGALSVDNYAARGRAVENALLHHDLDGARHGADSLRVKAGAQAQHLVFGAPRAAPLYLSIDRAAEISLRQGGFSLLRGQLLAVHDSVKEPQALEHLHVVAAGPGAYF